jgi:hypothetical protein
MRKRTQEEFIMLANEIHNNRYDYSCFVYNGSFENGEIICQQHGKFIQCPSNHLKGYGCKRCSDNEQTLGIDNFIIKAHEIHENKYNYSKFEYVNAKTNGIIICNLHGEFKQTPTNHLSGKGCTECGINKRTANITFTQEEFITKANAVHKNKYCYDNTNYINNATEIDIGCHEHGIFTQIPRCHLQGDGCPNCKHKNQSLVAAYLQQHNIKFETKSIHIDEKRYIPDFFLSEYKIMIEYNGHQHYEPVKFGSLTNEEAKQAFIKQQSRDEIIRQYCKVNDIILLEIDGRIVYGEEKIKIYLDEFFNKFMIKENKWLI